MLAGLILTSSRLFLEHIRFSNSLLGLDLLCLLLGLADLIQAQVH
jgi:hypothetical protein